MDFKEINIGKHDDLVNGGMKKLDVEGNEILLCRHDDKFFALGSACPHYGAPLDEGVLHDGNLICPWHHAAFDVETGALLEPPSKDCLTKFDLEIREGEIIIRVPSEFSGSRECKMSSRDPEKDNRIFVILGAGAAGTFAAETLRREGFQGRIIMISHERRLPYDRPNLSKEYMQGNAEPEWMPLRTEEFYAKHEIELMLGAEIKEADIAKKTIHLDGREPIGYDKLLIATGSRPRTLDIPGIDQKNIFTLRSFDDCDAIIDTFDSAKEAVIVGASFIGMEVAGSMRARGISVTVVAPESVPFENILGKEVGGIIKKAHEDNGVRFKLGNTVKEFKGNGAVKSALLENGEELAADLAVIGVGVEPVTGYIKGIELESDGSLKVGEYLEAAGDVYAAGDVARFKDWRTGNEIRIEHWRTAEQQGMCAAKNMLGKNVPYRGISFFWSAQAGLYPGYVGHASDWDEVVIHGELEKKKFIAYYLKDNRLHAALGNGYGRRLDIIEELMKLDRTPPGDKIKSESIDWEALLQ